MDVLQLFFAFERHKIIFLLRWMKVVQDYLQIVLWGVRGPRMAIAIAEALGWAAAGR